MCLLMCGMFVCVYNYTFQQNLNNYLFLINLNNNKKKTIYYKQHYEF
jgi:hypothetical protein